MARRGTGTAPGNELFTAAEATLIGLYNGGLLSPAVLERVIVGFANVAIDWHATPQLQSVDGKSVYEVVAMTMMPGRAIRQASKEFFAVIDHMSRHVSTRGGDGRVQSSDTSEEAATPGEALEDGPDDDLMSQLSGSNLSRKKAAKTTKTARKTAPSAGFNPLVHAMSPGRTTKS